VDAHAVCDRDDLVGPDLHHDLREDRVHRMCDRRDEGHRPGRLIGVVVHLPGAVRVRAARVVDGEAGWAAPDGIERDAVLEGRGERERLERAPALAVRLRARVFGSMATSAAAGSPGVTMCAATALSAALCMCADSVVSTLRPPTPARLGPMRRSSSDVT